MKKGIIFDVDGTLWDSCEVVADSWNLYLEQEAPELGLRLTAGDLRRVMGMTMTEIGDTLFSMVEGKRRMELTEGCCVFEVEYLKTNGGVLYPQVVKTLETLKERYHLYIVSNCQSGYIEDFIHWAKVEHLIEDFLCFGDTGREKSYNIRRLVERNGLEQAVYVGDTQGDYNSTKAAGLPFIHARYGFGTVEGEVSFINGLGELPEMVEQVLG